jgi:hypothetical protein
MRHKDGRIYVELPKAGGGERRIWSQPVQGGRMPWSEETANRTIAARPTRARDGYEASALHRAVERPRDPAPGPLVRDESEADLDRGV